MEPNTTFPVNFSLASNVSEANTSTFDVEAYILRTLGPRTLPLQYLVPVSFVYGIIFVTGIVGNVCTCIVISRNQYMQTPTNCYLFNLAIADMLTLLIAMPMELYSLWNQYPWQAGVVACWARGMVPEATAYASILTIVTFSTERFMAICHPIRGVRRRRLSTAVRNIALVWVVAAGAALPYGFYNKVSLIKSPVDDSPIPGTEWCAFPFTEPEAQYEWLLLCSTVIFFVLPVTVIAAMYVRIGVALHRSRDLRRATSEGGGSAHCVERERSKDQSRRMVIRMLVAVVIAFFLCWAPFHAQRLLFLYVTLSGRWTKTLKKINDYLFFSAGCFYYFNSTINPILYSVMSNRFRVAFREKLCAGPPSLWCICCCCFCCVRDFEKRSVQVATYRNSHSHSSVRSCINPQLHTGLNNNHRPRQLTVDYDPKMGVVHTSCLQANGQLPRSPSTSSSGRRYGPNLTISPPQMGSNNRIESSHSSSRSRCCSESGRKVQQESSDSEQDDEEEEALELAVELDEALRPQLEKLEETEKTGDCVSCTNCALLFPQKQKTIYYDPVDRTSSTELSQTAQEYKPSHSTASAGESLV